MTPDEILDAANRAYHEDRLDDWRAWHALLSILGYMAVDSRLVALAQLREESRLRLIGRRTDDLQFDYENEAQEQGVPMRALLR